MIAAFVLASFLAAPVAIENVRVEVGDGTTLERAVVVFDRGRVVSVGAGAPRDAERVDGTGKVLTPGLVEAVSQLGLVEVEAEGSTVDSQLAGGSLVPGFRVADGFNPFSPRIAIAREEGITSAVVVPRGGIVAGTASWVDLTGTLASRPDPTRPAAMLAGVGRGAADVAAGARGGVWMRLRQLLEDARFYRQNRAGFDRGDARALIVSPLHLAAMQPVLDARIPLVIEAHRASDILAALDFARGEKIRIAIAGGLEAWRVRRELAQARVPVIVKPSDQLPLSYEALAARDDSPALLAQAGVPLIIAAGGNTERRLRQEAGFAVAYGVPHAEAIRAITSRPAELYGKAGELGLVRPGMRASLVLWSGDPLELSTVAERVWIDGAPQSLDNRQRRLVERYLEDARR